MKRKRILALTQWMREGEEAEKMKRKIIRERERERERERNKRVTCKICVSSEGKKILIH